MNGNRYYEGLAMPAQLAAGKAFVDVLGDDGSSLDWGAQHIAPAYLKGLYCFVIGIPEGSWGAFGHTVSALDTAPVTRLRFPVRCPMYP